MHTILTLWTDDFADWLKEQDKWLDGSATEVRRIHLDDTLRGSIYGQRRYVDLCWERVPIAADLMARRMRDNDILLLLDADVILARPIGEIIGCARVWMDASRTDFIAQHDPDSGACTGFMAIRNCESARRVVDRWQSLRNGAYGNDQLAFNALRHPVALFPHSFAACHGNLVGGLWHGAPFTVPRTVAAFHCNYAIGIEQKEKLRAHVKAELAL